MNGSDWGLLFDEALLLVIATFLTLKGLILRRRTGIGRSLARNNFAFALAYYGAFLAIHIGFFQSNLWRWSVRVLVAVTAAHAIWHMVEFYGGWRGLGLELIATGVEFRDTWCEWGSMLRWRVRDWW